MGIWKMVKSYRVDLIVQILSGLWSRYGLVSGVVIGVVKIRTAVVELGGLIMEYSGPYKRAWGEPQICVQHGHVTNVYPFDLYVGQMDIDWSVASGVDDSQRYVEISSLVCRLALIQVTGKQNWSYIYWSVVSRVYGQADQVNCISLVCVCRSYGYIYIYIGQCC